MQIENNAYNSFFNLDGIAISFPNRVNRKQLSMPANRALRHNEGDNLFKFHVINICLRIKNWKRKKGIEKSVFTLEAYEARLLNLVFPKPSRNPLLIFIRKFHRTPKIFKNAI